MIGIGRFGDEKNKKTNKRIGKLRARRKYYVRIRTYLRSGGEKYYSKWSGIKSVKTR